MLFEIFQATRDIKQILQIVRQINTTQAKEFKKMSQAADDIKALVAEVSSKTDGVATDLVEVKGDTQEILDKLNALSGAPTPEEIDEIKSMLGGVITKVGDVGTQAREIADMVPEPEESPNP